MVYWPGNHFTAATDALEGTLLRQHYPTIVAHASGHPDPMAPGGFARFGRRDARDDGSGASPAAASVGADGDRARADYEDMSEHVQVHAFVVASDDDDDDDHDHDNDRSVGGPRSPVPSETPSLKFSEHIDATRRGLANNVGNVVFRIIEAAVAIAYIIAAVIIFAVTTATDNERRTVIRINPSTLRVESEGLVAPATTVAACGLLISGLAACVRVFIRTHRTLRRWAITFTIQLVFGAIIYPFYIMAAGLSFAPAIFGLLLAGLVRAALWGAGTYEIARAASGQDQSIDNLRAPLASYIPAAVTRLRMASWQPHFYMWACYTMFSVPNIATVASRQAGFVIGFVPFVDIVSITVPFVPASDTGAWKTAVRVLGPAAVAAGHVILASALVTV